MKSAAAGVEGRQWMKYAAPFDPTRSLKVPDTSLHLHETLRVAPYYKPREGTGGGGGGSPNRGRPGQREATTVHHEIDAAFLVNYSYYDDSSAHLYTIPYIRDGYPRAKSFSYGGTFVLLRGWNS